MTPVLFIHGLWLHQTSWAPWMELFAAEGYEPHAAGWPGEPATVEEARANPDAVADAGIDDIVDHHAKLIAALPSKPILVGHSFGGMFAQKLLGDGLAAAAVAIDAAQFKGVLPLPLSSLHATFPVFRNPSNKHHAVSLTAEQFRYAFAGAVPEEESQQLYDAWAIPSPGKPLFEAAAANFSPHSPATVATRNADRGPLLLVMGGQDKTVPEAITKAEYKKYRDSGAITDLHEFDDRAHSLTIDHGCADVARDALTWLRAQGL
ncbi:alpha/beta hydrolase [Actinomycetospora endophytica]|uniref:Alpha/beta hydrolase n=1 Tax=Actinomycetospora endophytica TaxID=2291215 RepID=A0ABS8PE21_9PSEU|nr:alpha/beta hydrolase [Actinomycetospora endophytica]MCD2195725.1 alpha/beta hydrolase [Actinomycetospora endophytica]